VEEGLATSGARFFHVLNPYPLDSEQDQVPSHCIWQGEKEEARVRVDRVPQCYHWKRIQSLAYIFENPAEIRANVIVQRENEDQRDAEPLLAVFSLGQLPNEQPDGKAEARMEYSWHLSFLESMMENHDELE